MVKGKSLNKYCEYLKITEDNVYMSKPKKKKKRYSHMLKNKCFPVCDKSVQLQGPSGRIFKGPHLHCPI